MNDNPLSTADVRAAIGRARYSLQAADNVADDLASLLQGRLRRVNSGYVLSRLKDELRNFNSHTKRWKP